MVHPPVGPTQLRAAVRQVLAEERAPRQAEGARGVGVVLVAGVAALVVLGAVLAVALQRPSPPPRPHPPVVVPPVPKPPPPPEPAPPPRQAFGVVQALAVTDGALYVASMGELVKFDRATRTQTWRAKLSTSGGGDLVPMKDRVVYANSLGVAFHDDETGAEVGQYLLRSQHFKVTACAAGAGQVLVKTVFDGVLRFDVATGKKKQGTGGCALHEDLRCVAGQRCGWDSGRSGELDCRLELRTPSGKLTFCEEDGTKAHLVVQFAGGKVLWKTRRGVDDSFADFASVLDGVLVVGNAELVEGFDPATGKTLWSHPRTGVERSMISDGHRLWFADGEAVVELSPAGEELGRFEL